MENNSAIHKHRVPQTWTRFSRVLLLVAAILGGTGVLMGAYAAHGLENSLTASQLPAEAIAKKLDQAEVAVRYQMYHALAILAIGITGWSQRSKLVAVAAVLFFIGVLLFSGVLYTMVLANTGLHYIVPFGGVAMAIGWLLLAIAAFVSRG